MPEVTGWDVVRAVKAARPALPVILLTGWGDQARDEAKAEVLADRILGKPIGVDDLLAVITELTGGC
jgi:DNA-binding response OmpR family regulator